MFGNKQEINWQDYLQIFLRRKWFFIIPFFTLFIVTIIASFSLPKVYEAKATILVEESGVINPLLRNLAVSTTVGERLHLLREEILSWPRIMQLVEELDLNKNRNSPLALERLIVDIRKRISVSMKEKDIIIISYQDKDPLTTQTIVNTISDIFIRRNLASQSEESNTAIDFIKDQLSIYKKKLETSEESLRQFKETYGLQMPLAAQINTDLARLEAELTTLLIDCTDEHPRVRERRNKIQSLKEKRSEQIKQAAVNNTNVNTEEYIEVAKSLPKQEQELARLTRDTEVNERLYALLLERLETARISQQLEDSENKTKFKIVEPARFPLKPVKPNKIKFSLLGLMLGIMAGFGCTYSIEYIDSSFKGINDLKSCFDIPVLGVVSKIITEEDIRKSKSGIFAKVRQFQSLLSTD
jgi:uncharacterized protein involved in exopolysaccharide biosynthesis